MAEGRSYRIQGRSVELPCVVRDAGSGNVVYMVPSEIAQKRIPGDAFEVVEAAPGMTQLILAIIDYRDNDLGDYHEVGIIFLVKPRGASPEQTGTFIYRLPVSQSLSCEAGCTIWGFPKTVEGIDFSYADETVRCRLEMDGRPVFTLTMPRLDSQEEPADEAETRTYTYLDGRPHATPFHTGGATAITPSGEGVVLDLGDHPLADELRELGLQDSVPVMSGWNEHMTGRFGEARPID